VRKTFILVSILICGVSLLCWLLYPDKANSGSYLDSAHGNTTYGVNRSGLLTFGYSQGNCAHCHEQHASIGGMEPDPAGGSPSKYELFRALYLDQTGMFCYACHQDPNSSGQVSMLNQFDYSRMAGGDTNICPISTRQAFQFVDTLGNPVLNCNSSSGSSHFLSDIIIFLRNQNWGFGSMVGNINPCSGCHNPHRTQKDPHGDDPNGRIVGGKLVSSVSRPSQHTDLYTWQLWGDDASERMNKYNYQPPYRFNSFTIYEPDGDITSDASRTVDYVTFCLDCHQYAINGTARDTIAINWGLNGDIHGGAAPQTCCDKGDKKAPYTDGINYVLSCLDCHEPHGSPNESLLRQEVNGAHVPNFDTHFYYNLCISCHTNLNTKHIGFIPVPTSGTDCWGCHRHGVYNYPEPLGCETCPGTTVKTF